jgi:hypothetical protein
MMRLYIQGSEDEVDVMNFELNSNIKKKENEEFNGWVGDDKKEESDNGFGDINKAIDEEMNEIKERKALLGRWSLPGGSTSDVGEDDKEMEVEKEEVTIDADDDEVGGGANEEESVPLNDEFTDIYDGSLPVEYTFTPFNPTVTQDITTDSTSCPTTATSALTHSPSNPKVGLEKRSINYKGLYGLAGFLSYVSM